MTECLFNPLVTSSRSLDDAELYRALFEKLDTRIESLQTDLIERLEGWSSARLSTLELLLLQMEF